MMSNSPSSLPQQHRQKLHRRQNSTPVLAFEAMKVSNLPQSPLQRHGSHRRGQSFDQQQRSPIRKPQGSSISITNLGPHRQQQILREAQQQRIARPGQLSVEIPVSAQCNLQPYNMHFHSSPSYDDMTMNSMMQSPHHMQFASSPYYPSMPNEQQNMALIDENTQDYFQNVNFMPTTIAIDAFDGRRMSQPDLRLPNNMRPHTPQEQIQNVHFPMTPPVTQHGHTTAYMPSHQASPAILSPYPIAMQRGRSLQGIIEHEEFKQENLSRSQPNMLAIAPSNDFETADMPVPSSQQNMVSTPQPEPEKDEAGLQFFDENGGDELPQLDTKDIPNLSSSRAATGSQSPARLALSPRRMSISDLNLEPGIEASIEETNVTLDDIAQYIEGPDPVDNKWVCKFEDCDKKFGRKENIKSHVQTHLGDRQFRCDHCKKCFVRGHDLKRHAKIHTGTKPYPCLCGNSFARHDALTRHRQRGMCIGAFDGVLKKAIKRGRPRKHRPEMDDRLDKAARSRRIAHDLLDQYASSGSSCSMSSWGSPPTESMDNLSIREASPFDDMGLFGVQQQNVGMETVGYPPNMFSFTPPASPGYSTGNKPSPSYRELTPADFNDMSHMPQARSQTVSGMPMMNAVCNMSSIMAMHSSQHSAPSLSHSSSSPIADVVAFDFSEMPINTMQSHSMKLEQERNDFDNFLDYGDMGMGLDTTGPDSFFTNL